MSLYPYQLDDKKRILEEWKTHSSILYQLPTGGGKTVVINSIIEDILDKKILILVHRQEIIFQIRDRLKQRGITAGVIIGNYEENIESDILIGSILTVSRDARLQNILDRNFDYMIIDEAHHACSDSYIKTILSFKEHNKNYKLLGVTATPYRKDKKKLNKLFDALIKGPTYPELRELGYLADYTCYAAKLEGLEQVDVSGGDFKLSALSKYMRADWLIEKAIKMYQDKGQNKQMLVFCVDKAHSLQVKQAYIDAGYTRIAHVDSDTPDELRKKINQDYRDKKIDIITSIQTFTEGVDLPNTGVVQLLRPTLSIVLYLQILGRGTRIKEDGDKLVILDLSNNSYEHGLLDSNFNWNLNNDEPNPDKKINKIVGKKKNGKITIDLDEIEQEYLEIEEMSHTDFLLQNQNGVEIAKKENEEKDKLIISLYLKLIEILNDKNKIQDLSFSKDVSRILNYNNWDNIKIQYKLKELCNLEYRKDGICINLGWSTQVYFNDYYLPIIKGKLTEFIQKDNIQKLLLDSWKEIKNVYESKTDINDLEKKIVEIEKEKCIFKINELLNKGTFCFKLNRIIGTYSHNWRDIYSFNEIVFNSSPNKIKTQDSYEFFNDGRKSGTHSSAKKEDIIDVLYNYWYKN